MGGRAFWRHTFVFRTTVKGVPFFGARCSARTVWHSPIKTFAEGEKNGKSLVASKNNGYICKCLIYMCLTKNCRVETEHEGVGGFGEAEWAFCPVRELFSTKSGEETVCSDVAGDEAVAHRDRYPPKWLSDRVGKRVLLIKRSKNERCGELKFTTKGDCGYFSFALTLPCLTKPFVSTSDDVCGLLAAMLFEIIEMNCASMS